jgi:two-component system sensor histidine kinase DesK
MKELIIKIHRKLLPADLDQPFAPYIWLVYLFIFFTSLAAYHPLEHSYLYASIGTVLFLIIYFNGYWTSSKRIKWNILAILVIGTLMTVMTPGASVFFVYAGAFCCNLGSTKKAFTGLFIISVWIGIMSLIGEFGPFFYVPAVVFTLMIGGVNIYQHDIGLKRKELILSQQEVRHLARTSERERIARDLHDLIGHTFSVITLKAELANKLLDKDVDRARAEISALETISRDALSQVREVVTGYRTSDLSTELAHAKYVLESNDIAFGYQFDEIEFDHNINKELAIILKELVTNILKHSAASRVDVKVTQQENRLFLNIEDDGVGFVEGSQDGFGLQGISERVTKLNGKFSIQSINGTKVNISIPLDNKGGPDTI